jgi:ferredoxin-NADP reductase
MQHIIELDEETEQGLRNYSLSSGETKKTILASAVKEFLQQHSKQKSLEQALKSFVINSDGFKLDRECANKR